MRCVLDRMVRLSYLERVSRELPAPFHSLLPPKPVGQLPWEESTVAVLEPGSAASLSAVRFAFRAPRTLQ